MPSLRAKGFTLVELMVTIAIVGVLVAVAVFAYTKYVRKGKTAEVEYMFAEIAAKQELYHQEMGTYLATEGYHPSTVGSSATEVDPKPTSWKTLRISPAKGAIYCQYRAYAGSPTTAPAGDYVTDLYPPNPDTNWFYLVARCDFDNDGAYAVFLKRSDAQGTVKLNEGE